MTFKGKLVVGVGAAQTILAAVSVLSYLRVREESVNAQWIAHTHQVIETLDSVLTDLVNAETGERGFLLIGENSYLQPYTSALQRLKSDLHQARELTADNPVQQRRLDRMRPLIASKLAEMNTAIDARRSEGLIAGADTVRADAGKQRMDQIRALIAEMKQEEERLLQKRLQAAASASQKTKFVILGGNLLGFLFLLAAGILIQMEMAKRARAESKLIDSEERFRLLVSNVHDYAIFQLDPDGRVLTWNPGAERLNGYRSEEIIGRHLSSFYTPEERLAGLPEQHLANAVRDGQNAAEGWRVRKDGSRFWASAAITALRDETGNLRGFGKVTRDLSERKCVEEELRVRNAQLETANLVEIHFEARARKN